MLNLRLLIADKGYWAKLFQRNDGVGFHRALILKQWLGMAHFCSEFLRRVFRSARPSGQLPRSLPLLMCPASPIITNSLPHLFANVFARESVTYGSFELATTILRNRSRSSGIGLKPLGPDGKLGASGSLGATRSAPRMGLEESPTAQCATSAHPVLCATSTVSGPANATARSSLAIQSAQCGVSQLS